MKKRLIAVLSVFIALFISVGALTGCDLLTTNIDRDMDQVVASVNIGKDYGYEGETEYVYKRDMIISFLQYGYSYTQNGSYSYSQVFDAILSNQISDRIFVQYSKAQIAKSEGLTLSKKDWADASKFLAGKEDSKVKAEYTAAAYMNSYVNGFLTNEEKKQDTFDTQERTVPTGATNYVEEISDYQAEVDKITSSIKGEIGSDQNIAYLQALKYLDTNGLLGKGVTDIFDSYYYKTFLNTAYEAMVINKYEQMIINDSSKNHLTWDGLKEMFNDIYANQKALYENDDSAYKTALGSATKTAPILYQKTLDGQNEFGYVWNLLIGATDEQTDAISKIDKNQKSDGEVAVEREEILKDVILKDQRSNWVISGYDAIFNNDLNETGTGTLTFVNDYSFTENGLPFQGKVEWLNKGEYTQIAEKNSDGKYVIKYKDGDGNIDDKYVPELRVVSVDEVKGIDDIITKITTLLNNLNAQPNENGIYTSNGAYNKDLIKDLIFAYSTDPGSLTSLNGYVIKLGDTQSTYVKEFQTDGEKLLNNSTVGALIVTATDYGYHFMFNNGFVDNYLSLEAYCEMVDGANCSNETYFNYLIDKWVSDLKDDDKDTYMYYLANTYLSDLVNGEETEITRIISTNENLVKKFPSAYSDLITD